MVQIEYVKRCRCCRLPRHSYLDLHTNTLSGTLPSNLIALTGLTYVGLGTGTVDVIVWI